METPKTPKGPPHQKPDMEALMARLAEIRAEVESSQPRPRPPTRLLKALLLLLVLVLLPLLFSALCRTAAHFQSNIEETLEKEGGIKAPLRH